jgi:hypothetical protein
VRTEDEEAGLVARPVTADVATPAASKEQRRSPATTRGRIFGGFLTFLSLWQALNSSNVQNELLGCRGLIVSVLWFVSCPRYLRPAATGALLAWLVVAIATAPSYVPRHRLGEPAPAPR